MKIKIGKVTIGDSDPFVVIPEGCDNHHGNLSEAKELAHAAKESGARIIKFQLHLPDEEMDRKETHKASSKMFKKFGDLYGFIQKNLLSVEDHAELIKYCKKINIQYFCTPFSAKAATILKQIGGDAAFKIGSGETEDLPMLERVAKYKKPMLISTGMTRYDEIDQTVKLMKKMKINYSLLHCISAYPPKTVEELHLGVIRELRERYDCLVGFSDHTSPEGVVDHTGRKVSEAEVVWGAIGQGARYIEKHFTLSRKGKDADSWFSHDPETLKQLIVASEAADRSMDTDRSVYSHEKGVWIWAKRSLYAAKDIKKGTKITKAMLTSKRPGTGIRSKEYLKIVGKIAKHDIAANKRLTWSDVTKK